MLKRDRFTVPLHCPQCGFKGSAIWEENKPEFRGGGLNSTLEEVSRGFYRRTEKNHRGGACEIICDRCGTLQPG